jgi:hypothetical protein
MRKTLFAFGAAMSILATPLPPAHATTAGTAAVVRAARIEASLLDDVKYVCHHRFYTSRRICWWRPEPFRKWRWRRWRRW